MHGPGAMLKRYQRYTPKLTNISKLKYCSVVTVADTNDLPRKFIHIKAIVSFCNRLRSCVVAAGGHSENLVTAGKKLCKVFFDIREHSMRSCMFP